MGAEVEEVEPVEETIEETEMVVEANVEKPEEAVAVVEVAVAEEDVATRQREEEAQAHSRGPSQTGIILLVNLLPSHPKTCNNSLKYVLQETSPEA